MSQGFRPPGICPPGEIPNDLALPGKIPRDLAPGGGEITGDEIPGTPGPQFCKEGPENGV